MNKTLQYNIVFNKEPEGGYTVSVPTLPGCITYGEDISQAKEMIEDAIKLYVESLVAHNEEVPTDEQSFFSSYVFNNPTILTHAQIANSNS